MRRDLVAIAQDRRVWGGRWGDGIRPCFHALLLMSTFGWDSATAYAHEGTSSMNGRTWTAKWWTQGDIPGNNSQAVWTDNGACRPRRALNQRGNCPEPHLEPPGEPRRAGPVV